MAASMRRLCASGIAARSMQTAVVPPHPREKQDQQEKRAKMRREKRANDGGEGRGEWVRDYGDTIHGLREATTDLYRRRSSGVSYGRVWAGGDASVWIGNIGASFAVADGSVLGFSDVVNASGCERNGISLGDFFDIRGRQSRYHTPWDGRGIALQDDYFADPAEVASNRVKAGEVDGPRGVFLDEHGRLRRTYISNQATKIAFQALVLRGADMVRAAVERRGKVLVHCYGGVNRSASVIVAFLLRERIVDTVAEAKELLMEAAQARGFKVHVSSRERRHGKDGADALVDPVLNNPHFVGALETLPTSLAVADAALDAEIEEISRLARQAPSPQQQQAASGLVASPWFDDDSPFCVGDPHDDCLAGVRASSRECAQCGGDDSGQAYACAWCGPRSPVFCSLRCQSDYVVSHGGCGCTRELCDASSFADLYSAHGRRIYVPASAHTHTHTHISTSTPKTVERWVAV
jgi:hypothetical protein